MVSLFIQDPAPLSHLPAPYAMDLQDSSAESPEGRSPSKRPSCPDSSAESPEGHSSSKHPSCPDSSAESPEGRSPPKRPPDDAWTQGHHIPKSSKADETSLAPQVDNSTVSEEQAARTSQQRLLSTLKQMMCGQPPEHPVPPPSLPVVASTSGTAGQPSSRTPTATSFKRSRRPTSTFSRQSREATPVSSVQSREPTPGDERTPPISRQHTPVYSRAVQQPSTPSSGSTIRTRTAAPPPIAPCPTTIQEILDSQQNARTVRDKGKQTAIESSCNSQSEFRLQGRDLPPWPSESCPLPMSTPSIPLPTWRAMTDRGVPGPSTSAPAPVTDSRVSGLSMSSGLPQSDTFPSGGPSRRARPDDGSTLTEVVAPLLSYFSSGMDVLLDSVQKSQARSHETIMKEIGTIREHARTSGLASMNQPGPGQGESGDSFPRPKRRKAVKRRHFVAADPELPVIRDEQEHSVFLRCIRAHTLTLLKIKGYKYLRNAKCSLSQMQVDEYEKGLPGCLEITPTDFMVDCLRNRDSPFNQDAATVFAEDFLEKVTKHSWYASANIPERYRKYETIRMAFLAHLSYVKARYREVVTAVDEDPEKARQATNARLQKSSRGSRKVRLLKMRLDAMADHPRLRRHLPLINGLGAQAMSSDESEDEVRRTISYPRVYPAWRSDPLASLLWQADDVAAANAMVSIGTRKKAGTQLRLRPHSGKVNTEAAAPPGLPRNCYNAAWLANLLPRQVKALRIQDEDYEFGNNGSPSSPASSSNAMRS